jgi:hypothetical protein
VEKRDCCLLVVAAVATIVLVIALATFWGIIPGRPPGTTTTNSGMATGLSALNLVETALSQTTNESWTLFSNLGIATHYPFTPEVLAANDSETPASLGAMWACASLPTASVWNVSGLPVRSGNLSDGYSPFWQFMFSSESNASQPVFAIGTYVSGTVHVFAPLPSSNACIRSLDLGSWVDILSRPDLDTNVAGPLAYNTLESWPPKPIPQLGSYVIIWVDGWPAIANYGQSATHDAWDGWDVNFNACGQVGIPSTPQQDPTVAIAQVFATNDTPTIGGLQSAGPSCTWGDYNLTDRLLGPTPDQPTWDTSVALEVNTPSGQGAPANDTQGLAAWMVRPQVNVSNGVASPVSDDLCPTWISNPDSCQAPSSGWYAVLETSSGGWLDSYGLVNGSAGWIAPNEPVVSNESFVIISSSSSNISNDSFTFTPLIGWPQIDSVTTEL